MECLFKKFRRYISAAVLAVLCAAVFLPVSAFASSDYNIVLEDLDDCLTSYEEKELEAVMQKTADKIKCNIGIVITADLNGEYSRNYTDMYSDNHFGSNSDSVVLLLLNRHDNPAYSNTSVYKDWISTSGRARELYDSRIQSIFNKTYVGLDNNFSGGEPEHKQNVYVASTGSQDSIQFYMAGVYFCKALKSYSSPVSRFFSNIADVLTTNILISFILFVGTIVIMIVVVAVTKAGYKRKKPISAAAYIDPSHFNVKREVDQFINEYTTSVNVSSSSGGGRSGGGGGGGSHGGGGGRSR